MLETGTQTREKLINERSSRQDIYQSNQKTRPADRKIERSDQQTVIVIAKTLD